MKSHQIFPITLLGLLFIAVSQLNAGGLQAVKLRCEYRLDPVGMDVQIPRLSWNLTSKQNGQKQTAYRILAASSPEKLNENKGDLWDSDKVTSDQTLHVPYGGSALVSRMAIWWKVQVWDRDGIPSGWSQPASWSMGLLEESDWEAQWIADPTTIHHAKSTNYGYHSRKTDDPATQETVTLNLRQEMEFDAVRLIPAQPSGPEGNFFPVRYKIEAANRQDFADAMVLMEKTACNVPSPGANPVTYRFPMTRKQFVRLTVTSMNRLDKGIYAFALSEMEVLREVQNIAMGAAVYASGSFETESWTTSNLTDGITVTKRPPNALPATMVRKPFFIKGPIHKATAYVSALGLYEFRLNGERVGDRILAPEWTSYDHRVSYQTYDVTKLLRSDDNVAAAFLGEGWYAGELMMAGRFNYGTFPRFLLQLEIEMADGSIQTIASDESWSANSDGPIRSSGIYDGEIYDARFEQNGWDLPGFDQDGWIQSISYNLDSRKLVWLRNEPIRVEMELNPVEITEPDPGVYVFDFGQNMVGWCRIQAEGTHGKPVRIRHGEAVNDDGTLYIENLRGNHQINSFTPCKNGMFTYEPRFTYHGFRYVEVTGLSAPPTLESITGKVFHSSSPLAGSFACSDPSLNRLMENIQWTQRGNLMSSPNDCPQRDERLGWMGDIQSFAQTAIFNMDMAAFFTKFLQDTRDDQANDGRFPNYAPHPGDQNRYNSGVPAWGDAGVLIPWTAYINYADTTLLREQYHASRRWIAYIHRHNPDLIWNQGRNNDYNDWLNGDQIIYDGWPLEGGEVPRPVFATAFFAQSTDIVARMAEVLGRASEAHYYRQLANQIKAAFNDQFVQPDGRILGNTQGGYALALHFNLLPDSLRPTAARYIVEDIQQHYNGHLSTGIQTTHRAMLELSNNSYEHIAWDLITNRSFPSWLYMVDNGATTIWERWDGYVRGRGFQDPNMNSLNHWALGSVGEWMWHNIIGLHPDEDQPGWKHFTIAPTPGGGLAWAKGKYHSISGPIACEWEIKGKKILLNATVPPNTTARVRIPTSNPEKVTINGKIVPPLSVKDGYAFYEIESGFYLFSTPYGKEQKN